jgi:hypothetical protein
MQRRLLAFGLIGPGLAPFPEGNALGNPTCVEKCAHFVDLSGTSDLESEGLRDPVYVIRLTGLFTKGVPWAIEAHRPEWAKLYLTIAKSQLAASL